MDRAEGAILAHSQALPGGRLRKGRVLESRDIAQLRTAGVASVIAAILDAGDLTEDDAATRIADALVPDPEAGGLRLTVASTGRVNVYATGPGVLKLDETALHALNRLDPMVTVATLPPFARLAAGTMAATVKIISYAVPEAVVAEGAALCAGALTRAPVRLKNATLVVTDLGQGPGKGEDAIALRLERLGMTLTAVEVVPHDAPSIAAALADVQSDLALLLTASATSDSRDVGPSGLIRAGGQVARFGMPVDPGNLLFYGDLGGRPVIGLPGCARSPALNGADWVLERLCCGLVPTSADIAAMGVGGLLKESPARPHPRARSV